MPRFHSVYRRDRSYRWNYDHGPAFSGPFPPRGRASLKDFLGLAVASRFGIAAGILLNARWIACYARLGFDILTYKTVRSAFRASYPLPNWVFVEPPSGPGAALRGDDREVVAVRAPSGDPRRVSSSVCFGMPSMAPEVWRRDVRRAKRALLPGQALIVSVAGTPREGGGVAELAADYARCAAWAAAAGADVVEANLSCPNVCSAEGTIYQDATTAKTVVEVVRAALPSTPLILKVGAFGRRVEVGRFCRRVNGLADGVVLVNGMTRRIVRPDGSAVFPGHEHAGVLGSAIREGALEHVRTAVRSSRAADLDLAVVGVGGVLDVGDIGSFLSAGAAAVLTGGGAAFDPFLAARMKKEHPEW